MNKDYTQKDIAEAFDKVFDGVKMNQSGVTMVFVTSMDGVHKKE